MIEVMIPSQIVIWKRIKKGQCGSIKQIIEPFSQNVFFSDWIWEIRDQ